MKKLNIDECNTAELRAEYLFNWSAEKRGRITQLSMLMTGKPTLLSHYKSGSVKISDDVWEKMKAAIKSLTDKPLSDMFEKADAAIVEHIDSRNSYFVAEFDEWIKNDGDMKIRLANVIYAHNYINNGDDTNYKSVEFKRQTSLLSSAPMVMLDRIKNVMDKIDELVANNSVFVIAARFPVK